MSLGSQITLPLDTSMWIYETNSIFSRVYCFTFHVASIEKLCFLWTIWSKDHGCHWIGMCIDDVNEIWNFFFVFWIHCTFKVESFFRKNVFVVLYNTALARSKKLNENFHNLRWHTCNWVWNIMKRNRAIIAHVKSGFVNRF